MKLSSLFPAFLSGRIESLSGFLDAEKKFKDSSVPLSEKLWLWRNGFPTGYKNLYGMTRDNIELYLDPVRYKKMHPVNGMYSKLIDSKAFLPFICPHVPELYVVVEKGRLRFFKGIDDAGLIEGLQKYMKERSADLICKPEGQSGGRGIQRINSSNVENVIGDLISRKNSFIINNCIIQREYSNRIFSGSVNTIRLLFYRKRDTGKLELAGAFHRFGTVESQPADNTMRGGIITAINDSTGEMGESFCYPGKKYSGLHSVHPDTGASIKGVMIPDWDERLKKILGYFGSLTWLDYAGADIVLTDSGFVILEINSLPGIEQPQRIKPFLSDKDLKEFFMSKGLKLKQKYSGK